MIEDFRLKVFKAVAAHRNFTKAAAELCISQPAVTKHINELERQVGTPLFIRKAGSITITDKGIVLLDYAHRILELYKELNNAFTGDDTDYNGTIRIGASTTISQYVLPHILAQFNTRYPRIEVILLNGNTHEIERMVENRQVDMGLIEGNSRVQSLHYEQFLQDEIVLVTAANRKNTPEEIGANDLYALPFVFRESGSGTLDVIDEALHRVGINRRELNIRLSMGSSESIKGYLSETDTYAFISIAAIINELKENKLQIVEIKDLTLNRWFRFVSLHGSHDKLSTLFQTFCLSNHNLKL